MTVLQHFYRYPAQPCRSSSKVVQWAVLSAKTMQWLEICSCNWTPRSSSTTVPSGATNLRTIHRQRNQCRQAFQAFQAFRQDIYSAVRFPVAWRFPTGTERDQLERSLETNTICLNKTLKSFTLTADISIDTARHSFIWILDKWIDCAQIHATLLSQRNQLWLQQWRLDVRLESFQHLLLQYLEPVNLRCTNSDIKQGQWLRLAVELYWQNGRLSPSALSLLSRYYASKCTSVWCNSRSRS